ncbi:nuclear pore complex protein NUP214 isoform X2 [Eucalyptus grandis]|uniref:nuclear pore complex protein NUP214 isoform X2 n=1 Tax=Eucalyptus grandis TaxID=71139 RepID=UPI00192F0811|nr:nuclear pore complex protein NUP214 isoform X2 [Eucalyptus grandis]
MAPTFEVKDEVEGEHVEASDFFYDCIGEPVPVRPTGGGGGGPELYDPGCLPSQPLAVSERFRLVFVAHPSVELILCREDRGCGGGREGDEGEGEPIFRAGTQRRGRTSGAVGLLWLSPDSSTLAASVGGTVNFFSVDSLLNKEQLPFFSCSIDEESSVKDMKWLKKRQNSYILLTSHGNLYLGSIDGPLKWIMLMQESYLIQESWVLKVP